MANKLFQADLVRWDGVPPPLSLIFICINNPMINILKYKSEHQIKLLTLLKNEPDWHSFVSEGAIDRFRKALLESETYICEYQGAIVGYIRALVDGFGVYISELYIAPPHRGNGYGARLLSKIRQAHPDQDVYVLSDEDLYYKKLGCKRVVSVFKL
ncbi:GNAT family N-acetyltransferase [Zobellella iuensis]|uniref:GNAT family N-acetyltransferase n=1 Tax=Zobellella iuensis TaxID=2803811 RepID=A0ABS1QUA5_9GAMM|nr:GNAT family N-acetyltransferase [Zobellella iuensis]MBL1378016.1 GNAT family N-acetyltransferase [Zobellella iuensis]